MQKYLKLRNVIIGFPMTNKHLQLKILQHLQRKKAYIVTNITEYLNISTSLFLKKDNSLNVKFYKGKCISMLTIPA